MYIHNPAEKTIKGECGGLSDLSTEQPNKAKLKSEAVEAVKALKTLKALMAQSAIKDSDIESDQS